MTKKEFKQIISGVKINNMLISSVESLYGEVPDDVKAILSYSDNDMFIGSWRVISKQELLNAPEELHVDFCSENLVPVLDSMDNDFICYDLKSKSWTLFNIVDHIKFSENEDICDYLDE